MCGKYLLSWSQDNLAYVDVNNAAVDVTGYYDAHNHSAHYRLCLSCAKEIQNMIETRNMIKKENDADGM